MYPAKCFGAGLFLVASKVVTESAESGKKERRRGEAVCVENNEGMGGLWLPDTSL